MIRSLPLALVLLLGAATADAQYLESFSTDGKGVAGACSPGTAPTDCATNDFSGVDWTLSGDFSGLTATSDFFLTSGGSLVAQDLDAEVCWNSPQVSISGTVTLELDLSEDGDHETDDYFNVLYSIDGGAYTQVPNVQGGAGSQTLIGDYDAVGNFDDADWVSTTVTVPGLSVASTLDVRTCAFNGAGTENLLIDEVRASVGSPGQTVTLSSSPADGGTIEEATTGSTSVTITLTTSDGNPTEGAVSGEVALTTGANDGDFSTTVDVGGTGASPVTFDESNPVTVNVPAGTPSGTTVVVEVTAIDDAVAEGDEAFQATVQNVSGASISGGSTFDFVIGDDDLGPATNVRINEVRIDQSGSSAEYAELSGTVGTLDGLTYLVIGDLTTNGGIVEEVTSLTGQVIPADGYFLMAESSFALSGSVDLVTVLTFENGDNVTHLLVEGWSGNLGDDLDTDDDGTLDTTPWTAVVDAVGFVQDPDGGDPYYGGALGFDDVGPDGTSVPFHAYRNESTGTFQIGTPDAEGADAQDTPGVANPAAVEVTGLADQAGWRLITLPIDAATIGDLAEVDLVQGVAGQYEGADDNVLTDYDGTSFVAAVSSGDDVEAGASVFKYFFDVDFDPDNDAQGGGTSESNDLAGFVLSLAGTVPTGDVSYSPPTLNADGAGEGFYMIGNPFADPLDLFGITQTAGDGTLNTTFQAWDPAGAGGAGAYVALDGSADDGTFLAVYQGVIAQVDYVGPPTTGPTFAFAFSEVDAGESPGFVGLSAGAFDVGLALTGQTSTGLVVGDELADLWFRPQGALGRDRVDASEIAPPGALGAQIALVEDGVYRAVRGVPAALDGPLETPVAFRTATAGTFTVGFDAGLVLPDGVTATLTDRVTGLTYEPGQTVTFEADASDWTERFTLFVSGAAVATDGGAEAVLRVGEVFPNPAAGPTRLGLEVDAAQRVSVRVYDALGRLVATAHDGDLAAGAPVDVALPAGLAPGAYAVRVTGETFAETRRMVVVR